MISSHFTIEREMVWVERYLIDIYDKVPLLGAIALFIPLCDDVDHISDAMCYGPFVAKNMRKIKIRRLLLVFFKYLRCTLGQRTAGWHKVGEPGIRDPR